MARYDDLNTKMIAYWAILSVILLVIILQGTQALCYNMMHWAESAKVAGSEADAPAKVKSEQLQSLDGYRTEMVLDETAPPPEKGQEPAKKQVIYIPLEEAQKLILKEFAPNPTSAADAGTKS